jgi:GMP synthase (glutamine-hydrolysing)
MSVLILKNVATEGPGTIEDYLRDAGISYRIVELSREAIPATDEYSSLVILGGPMSVNEPDIYPYIPEEEALVRQFIQADRKVLGICLGAQIMAKSFGATVYPGAEKEIGWYDIELTEEGGRDPLMRTLATLPGAGDAERKFKVFQWHGETFDLPAGGVHLAQSALFPHQAFRFGDKAYAFQFHIEVKKETVYEWLKDEPVDMAAVENETEAFHPDCHRRAVGFYRSFFGD